MSVDEEVSRLDRLERRFDDLFAEIRKINANGGGTPKQREAVESKMSEFSDEELQTLRDEKQYQQLRKAIERYASELEAEAVAAQQEAGDDEDDEDEDETEDEEQEAKPPTAKTKTRPRGGRHPRPEQPAEEERKPGLLDKLLSD